MTGGGRRVSECVISFGAGPVLDAEKQFAVKK